MITVSAAMTTPPALMPVVSRPPPVKCKLRTFIVISPLSWVVLPKLVSAEVTKLPCSL